MRIDEFDFELPERLIAQQPADRRDDARLLLLDRRSGEIRHHRVRDLPEILRSGDCLVTNDTRVVPARVLGTRDATGGQWEGLFVGLRSDGWEFLCRTRGKPALGESFSVGEERLTLIARSDTGSWILRPNASAVDPMEFLTRVGRIPLPPYIRGGVEGPGDRERYQTIFASRPGAVAAPTAGLHFTEELIARLEAGGVRRESVTLHVGPGTFLPIKVEDTEEHVMHSEWREISDAVADRLERARQAGGRIVAVGTTSVRTLESAVVDGRLVGRSGPTDLFITPGYAFGAVDVLLTNFHLPKSTLVLLVAAFAGTETVLRAYREAVRLEYRFYSYGDAMLIV